MALPYGARNPNRLPPPSAAHGGVVVVSIALAAALIVGGPTAGLIALLVQLLGCGALVVPVAVVVTTWARAGRPARALLALAGLACLLLLGLGVARVAAIVPMLL